MEKLRIYIRNNKIYQGYKQCVKSWMFFLPVNNKKVVFDNFGGKGYGDDPKYIAEELAKRDKNVKLIWLTSNMKAEFPAYIMPVKYGTLRAVYHLSTAKVWIDNIKSSLKVKKKSNQYYIQTWHSTLGFKMNEQDAPSLNEKYVKQAKEDAARTDLMYSDNDFRIDKYRNRYWYAGQVIKCDVPRMSIMYQCPEEVKQKVYEYFHISSNKKIVLYAPTFRKNSNLDLYYFDYKKCMEILKKRFGNEFEMVIRLHPNEAHRSKELIHDNTIHDGSNYPDMQELLATVNVLITDYSGCMFDCGFVRKPVFLFTKDLERYLTEDRKTYFKLDEVPFTLAQTEEELWNCIKEFSECEYHEICKVFEEKIGYVDSGQGAVKIADIIMKKIRGEQYE